MRCMNDEQIEHLAANADGHRMSRMGQHLHACESCRARFEAAKADLSLAEELRELRESREKIARLVNADLNSVRENGRHHE